MTTRALKTALLLSLFIIACSTANKPGGVIRAPASFCHPTSEDLEQDNLIFADPEKFEQRRKDLMNSQVQIYVRATELTSEFDAMLDKHVPLAKIYDSESYMQLLALQDIRKNIRHELENYFAAKVKQVESTGVEHAAAVHQVVDSFQREFVAIIQSRPDSRFAQLALLDIQDDFEDLRTYYVTCNYEDLHQAFKDRMAGRLSQSKKIMKSAPLTKNAYKDFAPAAGEPGTDINEQIRKAALEIREQVRNDIGRAPQAAQKLEPSAGTNGNMFGNGFPANTWALTFDDGPGATTHLVLDNLKKHHMKATFFIISQQLQISEFKSAAKREQEEGHAIACHSMTHPQIPKLDQAGRTREIAGAKKVFTDFFSKEPGDTPPLFFRLPYGAGVSVPSVRQMIADNQMIHVHWSVDTLDWQDHNPQSIHDRAMKQIKQLKHGIILFHDIHSQSVIASELLMHDLEDPANHIRLVTIPEITNELNGEIKDVPVVEKPAPVKPVVTKPATIKPSAGKPVAVKTAAPNAKETVPAKARTDTAPVPVDDSIDTPDMTSPVFEQPAPPINQ